MKKIISLILSVALFCSAFAVNCIPVTAQENQIQINEGVVRDVQSPSFKQTEIPSFLMKKMGMVYGEGENVIYSGLRNDQQYLYGVVNGKSFEISVQSILEKIYLSNTNIYLFRSIKKFNNKFYIFLYQAFPNYATQKYEFGLRILEADSDFKNFKDTNFIIEPEDYGSIIENLMPDFEFIKYNNQTYLISDSVPLKKIDVNYDSYNYYKPIIYKVEVNGLNKISTTVFTQKKSETNNDNIQFLKLDYLTVDGAYFNWCDFSKENGIVSKNGYYTNNMKDFKKIDEPSSSSTSSGAENIKFKGSPNGNDGIIIDCQYTITEDKINFSSIDIYYSKNLPDPYEKVFSQKLNSQFIIGDGYYPLVIAQIEGQSLPIVINYDTKTKEIYLGTFPLDLNNLRNGGGSLGNFSFGFYSSNTIYCSVDGYKTINKFQAPSNLKFDNVEYISIDNGRMYFYTATTIFSCSINDIETIIDPDKFLTDSDQFVQLTSKDKLEQSGDLKFNYINQEEKLNKIKNLTDKEFTAVSIKVFKDETEQNIKGKYSISLNANKIKFRIGDKLFKLVDDKLIPVKLESKSSLNVVFNDDCVGDYVIIHDCVGDVDNNNMINTLDALTILKYISKLEYLTDEQLKQADINCDNITNTLDSLMILQSVSQQY